MSSETEMLDYLRNIDTRPGPNAGRSIDPTKPGPDADRTKRLRHKIADELEAGLEAGLGRPDADRIAELEREIAEITAASKAALLGDIPADINRVRRAAEIVPELSRLSNEQPKGGADSRDAGLTSLAEAWALAATMTRNEIGGRVGERNLLTLAEKFDDMAKLARDLVSAPSPAPSPEPQDVRGAWRHYCKEGPDDPVAEEIFEAGWNAAHAQSDAQLPQPQRRDGQEPCGECHLQAGETCDICGAKDGAQPPLYKDIERILDDESAWIARPNDKVTMRVAIAAYMVASKHIAQSDAQPVGWQRPDAVREALEKAVNKAIGT